MGLKELTNTIRTQVEQTLSRAENGRAWLARVAYPAYQNAQVERWQTQNTGRFSFGGRWLDNSSRYKNWKRKGYANYPGSGRFVMIATARLVSSVIGQAGGAFVNNQDGLAQHRRIIGPRSLEVFTTVDYANKVAEKRPFMQFSEEFYRSLQGDYQTWITRGVG